jgi:arginase
MNATGNADDSRSIRRLALAGIPWDENSSYQRGLSEAPPLIRAALFSEASGPRSESGMEFQASDFFDAGDCPVRGGVEMLVEIERIGELLTQNSRPISLGGDHAITYPILKAFARHYRDLTVLLFDANSDLYDNYQGNRYSHACPFARTMEEELVTRLVQVGIRILDREQRKQAK